MANFKDFGDPYGYEDDLNIVNFKQIKKLENSIFLIGYNSQTDEDIKISGADLSSAISFEGSYEDLSDLPLINGVILSGDKSLEELGIQPAGDYATGTELDIIRDTKQSKSDSTLETTNKTIVGAINELKGAIDAGDSFLSKASNLSDLTNVSDARDNLNVYSTSEVNTLINDLSSLVIKEAIPSFLSSYSGNLTLFKDGKKYFKPNKNTVTAAENKIIAIIGDNICQTSITYTMYCNESGELFVSEIYINPLAIIGDYDWSHITYDVRYYDDNNDSICIYVSNEQALGNLKLYTCSYYETISL